MHELVDKVISDHEICIRCLLTPLLYSRSKKRLNDAAFLPPADSDEVSLLRLLYTDLNKCKAHAKFLQERIKDNTYVGLASITLADVKCINEGVLANIKADDDNSLIITGNIRYAPMNEREEYEPLNIDVYSDDNGLPMHANIIYSHRIEKGKVATKARKYARELIKLSHFSIDEFPKEEIWNMGEFYNS